jgi:hypothetical protein
MNPAEQETFFLTGVLDELKIIVSNSLDVWWSTLNPWTSNL